MILYTLIKRYLNNIKSLPSFTYNNSTLSYHSINAFNKDSKGKNDKNNKVRENIIGAIINKYIPSNYFQYSRRWQHLHIALYACISKLFPENVYNNASYIKLCHKGGRNYKYDFELYAYDCNNSMIIEPIKLELKFNAKCIEDTPQFVSPTKPSQYLTASYEEYYYDNYLPILANSANLTIPNKTDYLYQVHGIEPPVMVDYKKLYSEGGGSKSLYTGESNKVEFYNQAKKLSKESILNFITNEDLNVDELQKYIFKSQADKIYLLYYKGDFYTQIVNMDDYRITRVEKQPKLSRYDCYIQNGSKLEILLRWKNGNGIAYPAFQISKKKTPKNVEK